MEVSGYHIILMPLAGSLAKLPVLIYSSDYLLSGNNKLLHRIFLQSQFRVAFLFAQASNFEFLALLNPHHNPLAISMQNQ